MIELIKEFGMAILWLFLGYLVGERAAFERVETTRRTRENQSSAACGGNYRVLQGTERYII